MDLQKRLTFPILFVQRSLTMKKKEHWETIEKNHRLAQKIGLIVLVITEVLIIILK